MNRSQWLAAAVLIAILSLGMAGTANAQPAVPGGGPIARPTVSPYLNLLRGGNSAAFNYFSLVRPEQNALRAFQGLQAGVANNQAAISTFIGNGQLGATGMPTQFLNYGGFFMNAGTFQGSGPAPGPGGNAASGRTTMGGRTNTGAVTPRR